MITPPKRPESHRVGDVGQTAVSLQLKRWGWTADIVSSDYGEDIASDIFINERRTAFHFRCQVKSFYSNKGQIRELKSGKYSISIDSSTCLAWANSYFPVILVVYDDRDNKIYWGDVSQQVREKVAGLKTKTISLHISKLELQSSKKQLESLISKFYSKLLTLVEPEYTCNITPVLMPNYRALNISDLENLEKYEISLDINFQSYELLPSWITSIKSFGGGHLCGWKARSSIESLDEFFNNIKKVLSEVKIELKKGEWLSFIVSPVKFSEKSKKGESSDNFWNKQVTDWWCCSVLNGCCYSDIEHSFNLSDSFLGQIARHSRSWDGLYNVEPKLDIAVQVYSELATTPAYRESEKLLKKQTLGQFMPWVCKEEDLQELELAINEVGLIFTLVEYEEATLEENWLAGIINAPMFNPEIGLIPQSNDWDEFELGLVKYKLVEAGLLDTLPGRRGTEGITDFILTFFNGFNRDISEKSQISLTNYIDGMPLGHDGRQILFHKFLTINQNSVAYFERLSLPLKEKLKDIFQNDSVDFDVFIEKIDVFNDIVIEITVSMKPKFYVSTFAFVDQYKRDISNLLDVTNESVNGEFKTSETMRILKSHGELYFEGDSPWGICKVK